MGTVNDEPSALEECLQALNHLFIDISRLTFEPGYEENKGGYSDVRVATLDSGGPAVKLVAAKRLRLGIRSAEPKRLAFRLARELKVWAGLQHSHILPLLGFYLTKDGNTALLMAEYMAHGDLSNYLAKMVPPRDERLNLVRDLTDGLNYLHTRNIPIRHGDLKPGNVLVNFERHAVLSDFGLSKALGIGPTGFTTGNDPKYTTRYASPEVLLGSAALSLSNDIWSWACLTYEVMTEKKPFAHIRSQNRIILAIAQGEPPADIKQLSSLLPQLSDLLNKCWSYSSSERPEVTYCLQAVNDELSKVDASRISRDYGCVPQRPVNPDEALGLLDARTVVQPVDPSQPNMWNTLAELDEFFTDLFSEWLSNRRRTTKHSQVNGHDVELYKLFVLVGTLGGYHAVTEKGLWHIVCERMGLSLFRGSMPCSTAETAEQLRNLYQENLTSFEGPWHEFLVQHDPGVTFPLPRHLQMLRPDVERLATIETPVMKQRQNPSTAPFLQTVDRSKEPLNVEHAAQHGMDMLQALNSAEEYTVKYQASSPSSASPPNQGALVTSGPPPLPQSRPSLYILEANELSKLHTRDLKLKGVSSNITQSMKPNPQKTPPRSITGTTRSPEEEAPLRALPPGLLDASQRENRQTFVPLVPGLNVSREELIKAQEKASASISRYSHQLPEYARVVNASSEEALLLEREIQQLQTLLKNAVQNLTHYLVLAPEADERESHDVAMIIGILSNQVGILQNKSQEKRFMFELDELQRYETQLNEFVSRVERLQQEALAIQENRGPSDLSPGSSAARTMQQKLPSPLQQSTQAPSWPHPTKRCQEPSSPPTPARVMLEHQLPQTSLVIVPEILYFASTTPGKDLIENPTLPTMTLSSPTPSSALSADASHPLIPPLTNFNAVQIPSHDSIAVLDNSRPPVKLLLPTITRPAKPPTRNVDNLMRLPSKRGLDDPQPDHNSLSLLSGCYKRIRARDPQEFFQSEGARTNPASRVALRRGFCPRRKDFRYYDGLIDRF